MVIVSGRSILLILSSALILRKHLYEAFYIIHISLFILILIAVGMHHPDITLKALIIITFTPPSGLAIASSALPGQHGTPTVTMLQ